MPFSNVTKPSVSGTPQVGDVLTCTPGTWTGSPAYLSEQWMNGTGASPPTGYTAIAGALTQNGGTYQVRTTDVGLDIIVMETAYASPPPPSGGPPWATSSAMNTAIPPGTPYHPNSVSMVQNSPNFIVTGTYANWMGFEPRVAYQITSPLSSLPTQSFSVNYSGGYGCGIGGSVTAPWPSVFTSAFESTGYNGGTPLCEATDGISLVGDGTNMWLGYRSTPPGYASRNVSCSTAGWNAILMGYFANAMTGPGYNPAYAAVSASCIAAGCLVPADFLSYTASSVIPHAFKFSAALQSYGDVNPTVVSPAQAAASSGQLSGASGVPAGARFQLDPTIDVNTWPSLTALPGSTTSGVQGVVMLVCRTLQTYGMVYADGTGVGAGGIACGYDNTPGYGSFPWEVSGTWENQYSGVYGIPKDLYPYFHVIDWNAWVG